MEVDEASMTKKLPTLFGLVNIFDDPLTDSLNPPLSLWVELKVYMSWYAWNIYNKVPSDLHS